MFLLILALINAETLNICSMLRGLQLGDDDGADFFKLMNKMTLKHANAIGVKYNQNFTLQTFTDTGASGKAVLNTDTAFRILNSNCDFVVGAYSSSQVINVMPIFALNRLPACSGSASNQALENKVEYPYFLRTCPNDNIQGKVLARFVIGQGWKRVNIIHNLEAFALGVQASFTEELTLYNSGVSSDMAVKIATENAYDTYQKDFSLFLQNIKDSECTITLFLGEATEFTQMELSSKESQKNMFQTDYVWFGADTMSSYVGNTPILYSTPAADISTQAYADLQAILRQITAVEPSLTKYSQFSLEDVQYGAFYPSCVDVFLKTIDLAKTKNNVTTFAALKAITPDWLIANKDVITNMVVNGPSGNLKLNYNKDVISNYNIFQIVGGRSISAFVYQAETNSVVKDKGFQFSWLSASGIVADGIDVNNIANTVLNKAAFFYYIMIVLGTISIATVVVLSSLSIYKYKSWTVKRGLTTFTIIFGNISAMLFVFKPTTGICASQRFFGMIAINICGVLITMKLWKLFKTLSGIRMEIKGKSDESLKYLPVVLIVLNIILSIAWVIGANYKTQHLFTSGIGTNAYEFVCSTSNTDTGFFGFLFVFNAIIYLYAVFLSYVLKTNKISTKLSKYMNYVLFNALFFMILSCGFVFPELFNHTTKRIILSIFMFMATNVLFLLLRQETDKLNPANHVGTKSAEPKPKSLKFGSAGSHDYIDRNTLGSMVKLNSAQANDNNIFFDYVEVLDKKMRINVWRRFFLFFNGTDKYMTLHTIKKVSSNNDYQLKSEGTVFKLEFCTKPVLIEDMDRKNKIKIHMDNHTQLTIVFSSEEMVRKFKMLMNLCMANIRSKFVKTGHNALGGPGMQLSGSMTSIRSSEDIRKRLMMKTNSMDDLKKPSPSKSIENLNKARNL